MPACLRMPEAECDIPLGVLLRYRRSGHPSFGPEPSISAFSLQHDADRLAEDVHIEPGGPVADVVLIDADALGVGGVVTSGNLPEPGDARLDAGVEVEHARS